VVFALVTGLVVLRTRGIYFIMVTLAFAQMLFFVFHDTKLGGGSDGIYIYTKPTMKIGETVLVNLEKLDQFYWLVLSPSRCWCICCCAACSAPPSAAP
jgi:branched-chain amino acid transport system permease protein